MKKCPFCQKTNIASSESRGFSEEKLYPLILLRPFRCRSCGKRFYRFSLEAVSHDKARVKKRQRQKEEFPQFYETIDQKQFDELVAKIHKQEKEMSVAQESKDQKKSKGNSSDLTPEEAEGGSHRRGEVVNLKRTESKDG
jgi:transcriptional regulator NrdR family protein